MVPDAFYALLQCDDCHHSVESHHGDGCTMLGCPCSIDRANVIDANIAIENRDYAKRMASWRGDLKTPLEAAS